LFGLKRRFFVPACDMHERCAQRRSTLAEGHRSQSGAKRR
jgi:hypothetical protein